MTAASIVLSRMAADQDGTWGSVMFIPKGEAHPVSLHHHRLITAAVHPEPEM